jgi:hypothetical protein
MKVPVQSLMGAVIAEMNIHLNKWIFYESRANYTPISSRNTYRYGRKFIIIISSSSSAAVRFLAKTEKFMYFFKNKTGNIKFNENPFWRFSSYYVRTNMAT